jgi:transcriptional regulator with XRE-family HTH domain
VAQRFGGLLSELRGRRGFTQKAMAERLCEVSGQVTVSRHELSRWEREVRIPSDFWLGWLSEVLEEPVSVLEEARARSKGGKTMTGTAKSRTDRRTPTRPQSKRQLATVSLKFEHQATSVQLSGEYEEPEQAWAARCW